MSRAFRLLPSLAAIAAAAVMMTGVVTAATTTSQRSLAGAQAAGWDCDPPILIGGHYHCSPPGKEGVLEIIAGTATSPSIVHQVFRADGSFAGTETLIRADLFAGQPCPTDQWLPVPPWLPSPTYYACHHFAFTP
jgi:hypothetical protein